jgi:hypothetical protein
MVIGKVNEIHYGKKTDIDKKNHAMEFLKLIIRRPKFMRT